MEGTVPAKSLIFLPPENPHATLSHLLCISISRSPPTTLTQSSATPMAPTLTPRKSSLKTPKSSLKLSSPPPPATSLTPHTPHTADQPRRSSRRLSFKLESTPADEEEKEEEIRPSESKDPAPNSSLSPLKSAKQQSAKHGKHDSVETPKRKKTKSPKSISKDLAPNSTLSPPNSAKQQSAKDGKHDSAETPKRKKMKSPKSTSKPADVVEVLFSPVSPDQSEARKRKRMNESERNVVTRASSRSKDCDRKSKKRVYYRKAVYDGGEFAVGDDVYVKRREDASSDDEDPEAEECRICFKTGKAVMIECDDCLGGFHLKCLRPPLKDVPEEDWICPFCEGKRSGKEIKLPKPPAGKKRARTLREKLLSSDLWAARIESLWMEKDGSYWFRGRWYIIPEETTTGRQPHNLKRELYRTNDFADIEMESVLRHCSVMNPKEYAKAKEGDDIFMCEYEYDIRWNTFKRIAEIDDDEEDGEDANSDEDWNSFKDEIIPDSEDDMEYEAENDKSLPKRTHSLAANSKKGHFYGLQKIGTKVIPEHVRCHKQTDLERAKATLLLATLPKFLPCRNKEMEEITTFIKGAICDDQCLGRCLYIHGVPGTGKTMSVLSVMRNLRAEVDAGTTKPYCFVEVNGLKLASPENIYRVIYEALTGHRVSWKKALHLLNERFSNGKSIGKGDDKPCILLIDELDLLVTRNQSVLYHILDWPNKPHSKLIVLGIANTMDLPEKLLPRISSRLGIQRLCFGPYNYQQLQEIISSRLKGIDVFDKQAIEFASRKVAAISGDARRALEICRRAAEVADYRIKMSGSSPTGEVMVVFSDVEAAIEEMFQAPHIQAMRSCSKVAKIFLTAMVYELYKTGMGETSFEKVATTVSCFCTSNKEAFPGWDTLMKVGCMLGESRIVVCEPGVRHMLQKLQLNFPSDDVTFALKDCKEMPWLDKYL